MRRKLLNVRPSSRRFLGLLCPLLFGAWGACSFLFHPDDPPEVGDLRLKSRYWLTGEPVVMTTSASPSSSCVEWSVEPAASARLSARPVDRYKSEATLIADAPGLYTVKAKCGDSSHSVVVEAIAPSVRITERPPQPLETSCFDAESGPNQRLFCVNKGLHVLDAGTGKELEKTEERVPQLYGIASDGSRLAVATTGCPDPNCKPAVAPGVLLYEINPDGTLGPARQLTVAPANEVAIANGRIAATTAWGLQLWDAADPVPFTPRCVFGDFRRATPGWVQDLLVSYESGSLRIFDPAGIVETCISGKAELATLPVPWVEKPHFPLGPEAWNVILSRGRTAYLVQQDNQLTTVDLSTPTAPKILEQIRMPIVAGGIADDRLWAVLEDRVVVFDLSDPARLRPIGLWRNGGLSVTSRLAVAGKKVWILNANSPMLIELLAEP